jgi:hypothetical protein
MDQREMRELHPTHAMADSDDRVWDLVLGWFIRPRRSRLWSVQEAKNYLLVLWTF